MDERWGEERVHVHLRDPFHRVDLLDTSRHVVVTAEPMDGLTTGRAHTGSARCWSALTPEGLVPALAWTRRRAAARGGIHPRHALRLRRAHRRDDRRRAAAAARHALVGARLTPAPAPGTRQRRAARMARSASRLASRSAIERRLS